MSFVVSSLYVFYTEMEFCEIVLLDLVNLDFTKEQVLAQIPPSLAISLLAWGPSVPGGVTSQLRPTCPRR